MSEISCHYFVYVRGQLLPLFILAISRAITLIFKSEHEQNVSNNINGKNIMNGNCRLPYYKDNHRTLVDSQAKLRIEFSIFLFWNYNQIKGLTPVTTISQAMAIALWNLISDVCRAWGFGLREEEKWWTKVVCELGRAPWIAISWLLLTIIFVVITLGVCSPCLLTLHAAHSLCANHVHVGQK